MYVCLHYAYMHVDTLFALDMHAQARIHMHSMRAHMHARLHAQRACASAYMYLMHRTHAGIALIIDHVLLLYL